MNPSHQQCPTNYSYNQQTLTCQHFIFPPTDITFIAFLMTFLIAGFSSLAGVGGGTPHLVVIMILYNYTPKNSTIVIFSSILGTTLGNVLSQMRKKINQQPIIQYQYAFVSIPIMFMGSIIGVLINKLSPSILICGFIMYIAATSIRQLYNRFRSSYHKQSQQLLLLNQSLSLNIQKQQKYIQTQFNPLSNPQYKYIFKNLLFLFILFISLSLIKGTEKLNSIIGVERCSFLYWVLYVGMFGVMLGFSYMNLNIMKKWSQQPLLLNVNEVSYQLDSLNNNNNNHHQSIMEKNINFVAKMSCMAGVFSGLGLGGGLFLVPMYKNLGCNSIQAAATCAFSIFTTSLLNCIQGILLGVIKLQDFLALFLLSIFGSYVFCTFIIKELQKRNRISLVEAVLLILVCVALINLPFSLYMKYERSGYDLDILFGFGRLC